MLYGFSQQTAPQQFGAFHPTGGGTYYLQSAINSTQTTIALSSFTEPGSNIPYTMTYLNSSIEYATINPTGLKSEFVSFTGITQNSNGTALLTGVTRGLGRSYPYTASSTLAYSAPGQSQFILSAPPQFYNQFYTLQNNATSSAILTFGSTTPPQYDADPTWANFSGRILADINYVNSVVAAGAANASETVKGIVQLATATQAAAGTSLGSTAARLALGANLATSTPGLSTVTGDIPATTGSKLSQLFLDLTQAFNVSGLWTFNAGFINTASTTFNPGTLHIGSQTLVGALFGGTGTDGALSISSGTTTLSGAINGVIEKDYTSISITGTANLAFSGAQMVILRSQGACTDTSSKVNSIDGGGYLGAGGSAGSGVLVADTPSSASGGLGGSGGGSTNGTGGKGTVSANSPFYITIPGTQLSPLATSSRFVPAGGNGSSGTSGGNNGFSGQGGGGGGNGGTGIYIECAGNLNFTGGISTIGANGQSLGANGTGGAGGGGGGGGGGGNVEVLYGGSLTADSSVYNMGAGVGGTGGTGVSNGTTGQSGAAGTHLEAKNTYFY